MAKYQIPTIPNLAANPDVLALLPAGIQAGSLPVVDQFQKENNQYSQLVWRHDVNAAKFFSLGFYFRRGEADFHTPALNALAYADDVNSAQTANQRRTAYTGGGRLDHTWVPNSQHLVKTGFQIDYTNANNTAQIFAFDTSSGAPAGPVLSLQASNRNIQWREEFWVQDQWSPNDQWTFNLGVRGTSFRGSTTKGKSALVSAPHTNTTSQMCSMPTMVGLFTPPNVEQIAFVNLNTQNTTAAPDDPTGFRPRAERSHYFEVGSYHAVSRYATLELTGYYKLDHYMSDAGQFGTTPMLNYLFVPKWMETRYRWSVEGAIHR